MSKKGDNWAKNETTRWKWGTTEWKGGGCREFCNFLRELRQTKRRSVFCRLATDLEKKYIYLFRGRGYREQ